MAYDATVIHQIIPEFYGNKPHPMIPEIKVKEYESFARVAARLNETRQPNNRQVQQAYHLLSNMQVAPAEFERIWDQAKPLANTLLGRNPNVNELPHLMNLAPQEIHAYYMNAPHPDYPHVPAGQVANYYHVAGPAARELAGREPNVVDAVTFASGKYTSEDITAYYSHNNPKVSDRGVS